MNLENQNSKLRDLLNQSKTNTNTLGKISISNPGVFSKNILGKIKQLNNSGWLEFIPFYARQTSYSDTIAVPDVGLYTPFDGTHHSLVSYPIDAINSKKLLGVFFDEVSTTVEYEITYDGGILTGEIAPSGSGTPELIPNPYYDINYSTTSPDPDLETNNPNYPGMPDPMMWNPTMVWHEVSTTYAHYLFGDNDDYNPVAGGKTYNVRSKRAEDSEWSDWLTFSTFAVPAYPELPSQVYLLRNLWHKPVGGGSDTYTITSQMLYDSYVASGLSFEVWGMGRGFGNNIAYSSNYASASYNDFTDTWTINHGVQNHFLYSLYTNHDWAVIFGVTEEGLTGDNGSITWLVTGTSLRTTVSATGVLFSVPAAILTDDRQFLQVTPPYGFPATAQIIPGSDGAFYYCTVSHRTPSPVTDGSLGWGGSPPGWVGDFGTDFSLYNNYVFVDIGHWVAGTSIEVGSVEIPITSYTPTGTMEAFFFEV